MIKTVFSGQTAGVRLPLRFRPDVSREKSIKEEKEVSKSTKLRKLSKTKKRRQTGTSRLGLRKGGRTG